MYSIDLMKPVAVPRMGEMTVAYPKSWWGVGEMTIAYPKSGQGDGGS